MCTSANQEDAFHRFINKCITVVLHRLKIHKFGPLRNSHPQPPVGRKSKRAPPVGRGGPVAYLRNNKGASAIAPYSTRARDGSPIAVPLPWSALDRLKAANSFTVKNAAKTLAVFKDPWPEFWKLKQKLPKITMTS